MIKFNVENNINFKFDDKQKVKEWIKNTIISEGFILKNINFIFCNDIYLNEINKSFLHHEDFTDVITFDYSENKKIEGDIFISIERVEENAGIFEVTFKKELFRVIIHGILHLLGYKDKQEEDIKIIRYKEDFYLEKII